MNSNYVPVETDSNLVRDVRSNAILNVNVTAFDAYKKSRERTREMDRVVSEHDDLKAELSEIKGLLQRLLDKSL